MSYNDGAEIVPSGVFQNLLRADPRAANAKTPDNYARFQLLTEAGYHALFFENYDRSYIQYGADSPDFPLCADFAEVCHGDVLKGAIKAGFAIRPGCGALYYTKNAIDPKTGEHERHAIEYAACAGTHKIIYREPQDDAWMSEPDDCLTMDEFRA